MLCIGCMGSVCVFVLYVADPQHARHDKRSRLFTELWILSLALFTAAMPACRCDYIDVWCLCRIRYELLGWPTRERCGGGFSGGGDNDDQ